MNVLEMFQEIVDRTSLFNFPADYRPDDARLFRLDAVSRQLSLSQQLDREHIHRHIFRVVTTNRQTYPTNPQPTAFITVNVTVNDVNDNPPRFEYRSYGSGITQADAIGKHVLTVHADDPDLDDVVTYAVEAGSYVPSHASLRAIVENNPFELNAETGELRLNFAVAAEMRGHIEFRIKAFDLGEYQRSLIKVNSIIVGFHNESCFV